MVIVPAKQNANEMRRHGRTMLLACKLAVVLSAAAVRTKAFLTVCLINSKENFQMAAQ